MGKIQCQCAYKNKLTLIFALRGESALCFNGLFVGLYIMRCGFACVCVFADGKKWPRAQQAIRANCCELTIDQPATAAIRCCVFARAARDASNQINAMAPTATAMAFSMAKDVPFKLQAHTANGASIAALPSLASGHSFQWPRKRVRRQQTTAIATALVAVAIAVAVAFNFAHKHATECHLNAKCVPSK